jgi:hypothetical protein
MSGEKLCSLSGELKNPFRDVSRVSCGAERGEEREKVTGKQLKSIPSALAVSRGPTFCFLGK